jgi:hypothetical protein
LRRVDFPHPDGPTKDTKAPSGTTRSTGVKAWTKPPLNENDFDAPLISIKNCLLVYLPCRRVKLCGYIVKCLIVLSIGHYLCLMATPQSSNLNNGIHLTVALIDPT